MNLDFLADPFIISAKPLKSEYKEFNLSRKLESAYLYWNDKTNISEYYQDEVSVFVIGYIVDINNGDLNINEIQHNMINKLNSDYKDFLDYLDCLNGRYILIIDYNQDTIIYTDATSLRPIYYWENNLFASHEIVVKEVVTKETDTKLTKTMSNNGYLDYTSYNDIFKFIPNYYFSFNSSEFIRFFPRENANIMPLDQVVSLTKKYYQEQIRWLNNNYEKIYLSLTGGIDSKFSLAIAKDIKYKTEYFTYMIDLEQVKEGERKRIYALDDEVVKDIAYNFDLNHQTYMLKDYQPPNDYRDELKNHISSNHSIALSYLFHKNFDNNTIHLKSTINEIGKLPFPESIDYTEDYDVLFNYSLRWQVKNLRSKPKLSRKMFDDYIKKTHFKPENLHGFNMPLLFYWETRMGNWHSNITQETDNTIETFILVNSRRILSLISQLSLKDRKGKKYLYETIDEFWPVLNYFVPNSMKTIKDELKYNNKVIFSEDKISITKLKNLTVRCEDEEVTIQPINGVKTKDDSIRFRVNNESEENIEISVLSLNLYKNNNIYVKINEKTYAIDELKKPTHLRLAKGAFYDFSISYSANYKGETWLNAAKLAISRID